MSEPTPDPVNYPDLPSAPASAVRPGPVAWIAPLALVISLLAAGAAGWALFKPTPTPVATDAGASTVADPKGEVCSAFKIVSTAVTRYTNVQLPDNLGVAMPGTQEAIAANARLAMTGGSAYLLRNLAPNTPPELADNVRSFAGTLDSIGMKLLTGIPNDNPELVTSLQSAEASNKRIAELCK
ncbi:MAG: hypothetical protein NT146_15020 [Mycobacterium sp.]|nr:hypothetical protein [Mycobacterium sp.]